MKWICLVFVMLLVFACNESEVSGVTVGFYNVENLFDTIDDPTKYDEQYTPSSDRRWNEEKYQTKLTNLAKVISQLNNDQAPEFLGLCEVENREVLEDLIATKALEPFEYKIAHIESPDERGIDVAFLYQEKLFKVTDIDAHQPDLSAFDDKTRDILHVEGKIASGESMHFIVNHWPSRGEGLRKSEPKRILAAEKLKEIYTTILREDPQAKIIVMGDFNDEPSNKSISNTLAVSCDVNSVKATQLFNAFCELEQQDFGSYKYRSYWDMLDQIMISNALLADTTGLHYQHNSASIKNEYWLEQHGNKYEGSPLRTFGGRKYLGGYSDHFPVYISLEL